MTGPVDLPASIYSLAEHRPIEDFLLRILRRALPEVPVVSLIPEAPPPFFVLVRRMTGVSLYGGDPRFTDEGRFFVHTFTQDPDGDAKGAILSEAVRVALRTAWLEHWSFPDLGSVISIDLISEPSRKTDWATSAGPVQYADLPNGFWRYESVYTIRTRKPRR
jgi:hypothetical protein